jgi:SAM-dependent methyltransferase
MQNCRLCNTLLKAPFLSLGNSPFSNSYLSKDDLDKMEPYFPLELYICEICYLVQINQFTAVSDIFSTDYAYHSSFSAIWLKHAKDYVEMIIDRLKLNKNSFVVEVASNDGYLLQYFLEKNIPLLGIEPTEKTASVAIKKGINTDKIFFDTKYAIKMRKTGNLADLIIGNNVLAHNPDLNDFVEGLKIALKPEGVITMEFPHLLCMLDETQFDTIYHEHYSYFTFYTVQKLFSLHKLEIFDVEELPTHGGSLRVYCKHEEDDKKAISANVNKLLDKENDFGLFNLNIYSGFKNKVEKVKRNLLYFLIQEKNKGKKIIGYGAPAKGNTLLNYCGIRTDFLDYTVDRSPYKQNKFLPGTHIPVKSPEKIKGDRPDYILILPWNIKDEIVEQMSFIREWGGKFIVPIPEIDVI